MKRTVLTFGIMAGGLIFAYSLVVFLSLGDFSRLTPNELAMAEWLGYLRYVLLLLGVVMGMMSYRKNMTGPISYGRVFKVGLLIALITGVFVGLMEFTYLMFNPDFYDQYARVMTESMKAKGATAAELKAMQQQMADLAWMTPPPMTGLFYFVETSVVGTIMSLIAAGFMRRKADPAIPDNRGPVLNQPA